MHDIIVLANATIKLKDIDDCEAQIGITFKELTSKIMENVDEKSEKVQCFQKCMWRKNHFLLEDGHIDLVKIQDYFSDRLSSEKKTEEMMSCLKGIGLIESCQDMLMLKNFSMLITIKGTELALSEDQKIKSLGCSLLTKHDIIQWNRLGDVLRSSTHVLEPVGRLFTKRLNAFITFKDIRYIESMIRKFLFLTICILLTCSTNGSSLEDVLLENLSKVDLEQCEQEVGITLEEVQKNMTDPFNNGNEKWLCMAKCIAIKQGLIRSDETIDSIKIRAIFGPLKGNFNIESLVSCMEKIGKISSCQDVLKIRECYKKEGLI
ncbi:uncharacterized protein [Euwallacea similis]|uniref:uncharacterized protein n=1 Tax=Euwallacea similis TaxID=1736056 RepID=UPI00344DD675